MATQIYEAITAGRFADARARLARELHAAPASPAFLGLEALLEFRQNNRAAALAAARRQVAGPAVNLTTITVLLGPVLLAYDEPALLSAAFEGILRRAPQDTAATDAWTEFMAAAGHVRGLAKAAAAAHKARGSRLTAMQTAFLQSLVLQEAAEPDAIEHKLYPALALRLFDKALPATNPQEAYAYAMVCRMSGPERLLAYARAPEQRDLQSLELELEVLAALTALERWGELWEYAETTLKTLDSFNYWQALNSAAVALGRTADARALAESRRGLNARLSAVDLAQKMGADPLPALQAAWAALASKPAAYEHLRAHLGVPGFGPWLHGLEPPAELGARVNLIKLRYALDGTAPPTAELVALYQAHLGERSAEKTDYFVGTDLLLVAALELLKRADDKYRLVKAAVLLEHAAQHDPASFYTRLWLVRIYRGLGALAKAAGHREKLAIKNMQLESLGHLAMTRAGSLGNEPKLVGQHTQFYERAEHMVGATQAALEGGVFTQLPGMLALQRRLTTSLGRPLAALEALRTARVGRGTTNVADVLAGPDPGADGAAYTDNRDYRTQFDPRGEWGAAALAAAGLEPGPRPGKAWVAAQVRKEAFYLAALRGEATEATEPFAPGEPALAESTAAERWNLAVVGALGGPPRAPVVRVADLAWPAAMGWEFLHTAYTALETLKVCEDYAARHKLRGAYKPEAAAVAERVQAQLRDVAGWQARAAAAVAPWAAPLGLPYERVLEGIANTRTRGLTDLAALIRK